MSACRARTGFELVHFGDTIQSMMQVFFDKEIVRGYAVVGRFVYADRPPGLDLNPNLNPNSNSLARRRRHIDKTEFLHAVVREKKWFENTLNDRVTG